MKQIIYSLWILLFLVGCSESDKVDYTTLTVDFQKSRIDVGENSGVLEIPVVLSGCRSDIPLNVSVQVTAEDHSGIAGVDYELLDSKLIFQGCGTATLRVRIIDNDQIEEGYKSFTIHLNPETAGVQTKIPVMKVDIISDDIQKFTIAGNYTFTAQNFIDDSRLSSTVGAVQIVADENSPGRYVMHNLVLTDGEKVLPLTRANSLYFTVDAAGKMMMPVEQGIGDYGKGDGFTIRLTDKGYTSVSPIEIQLSGNRLIFVTDGLAGIAIDDKDQLSVYYALKNIILEKVNT